MADTFTPVQGFLAGFYRAVGLTIGAATVFQPLTNRTFETGDLTGWTDDCAGGASSATVTANKGWEERSYGVVLSDDGTNLAGISQVVTLDTALTAGQAAYMRVHAAIWAEFDAVSDEATLKVECLDAVDASLGNATVTMISAHPIYDDGTGKDTWGYFSVAMDAITDTKKIKISIYSNAIAAQVLNIDNATLVVLEQVAGAFGPMGVPEGFELKDSTTFATAGTAGFRSFLPVLKKVGEMSLPSFWVSAENLATQMGDGTRIFCVLWTQKATKTSDRFEFWCFMHGIEWSAAPGEIQQSSMTITVDGAIGFADR